MFVLGVGQGAPGQALRQPMVGSGPNSKNICCERPGCLICSYRVASKCEVHCVFNKAFMSFTYV